MSWYIFPLSPAICDYFPLFPNLGCTLSCSKFFSFKVLCLNLDFPMQVTEFQLRSFQAHFQQQLPWSGKVSHQISSYVYDRAEDLGYFFFSLSDSAEAKNILENYIIPCQLEPGKVGWPLEKERKSWKEKRVKIYPSPLPCRRAGLCGEKESRRWGRGL